MCGGFEAIICSMHGFFDVKAQTAAFGSCGTWKFWRTFVWKAFKGGMEPRGYSRIEDGLDLDT